ncbi:hypothetical protein [Chitinimonas sp. BJYL2]|uniref:hypothetical protein n=1 Tax=Chitinimonas sp. BJYL2 TaxID=2976696 RepID=UPI0022B45F3F|nr:hypothetical protein [Chitinimonas sp. BJYL2]
MDKASQRRWLILGSVLAATVIAMLYPVEQPDATLEVTESAVREAALALVPAAPKQSAPVASPAPTVTAATELPDTIPDPFANKGWTAPPPAPVPVAAPAPVVSAPIPVGPPPLPFKFLGRFNDGGQDVVYLSRGEQMLIAKAGEALDASYKVIALTASQIEFEHLPTGEHQSLALSTSDS